MSFSKNHLLKRSCVAVCMHHNTAAHKRVFGFMWMHTLPSARSLVAARHSLTQRGASWPQSMLPKSSGNTARSMGAVTRTSLGSRGNSNSDMISRPFKNASACTTPHTCHLKVDSNTVAYAKQVMLTYKPDRTGSTFLISLHIGIDKRWA